MTYEEIISKIQACSIIDEGEFDLFIDDIAVTAGDLNLSIGQRDHLIGQLLLKIENQPDAEFTSWSLVHFLEWLDHDNCTSYNTQILKSLQKEPKYLTLLLANRILNELPDTSADRALFLTVLQDIASSRTADEHVREEAKEFYEYQLNKEAES